MKDADMNLRQWFKNSPGLTTIIATMRTGSKRDHAGLLGMMWNPKKDTLQFLWKAIVIPPDVKFTKRQVVSSASSTFDPIGSSPVLVPAKNERLLRTISYALRFILNLKHASDKSRRSRQCPSVMVIPVPTAPEISQAEVILLRAHQIQHFRQKPEYLCTKQSRPTCQQFKPRPQMVRQLNLKFMFTDGLLVAPGRLKHAMLEQDAREPILIAKKSPFIQFTRESYPRE